MAPPQEGEDELIRKKSKGTSEHVHRIVSFEEASRLNYFRDGRRGLGVGVGWVGGGGIEKMIKK